MADTRLAVIVVDVPLGRGVFSPTVGRGRSRRPASGSDARTSLVMVVVVLVAGRAAAEVLVVVVAVVGFRRSAAVDVLASHAVRVAEARVHAPRAVVARVGLRVRVATPVSVSSTRAALTRTASRLPVPITL